MKRLAAIETAVIAALTWAIARSRREYRMARCAHLAALRVGAQQLERAEAAERAEHQLRARLTDWVAAATDQVNTSQPREARR